jgi:hypothetical protein
MIPSAAKNLEGTPMLDANRTLVLVYLWTALAAWDSSLPSQ